MKFLIVDDHAVVREGLAAVLTQAEPDSVVVQAKDCASALAAAAEHPDTDIVLMDLRLPDAQGLSAVRDFVTRFPGLPVMVVSSSEDTADVREALGLGALGYVAKSASAATLLSAIKLVLGGDVYVPPFIVQELGRGARQGGGRLDGLTDRQRAVLDQVCAGASNKQIAYALSVTEGTVKAHLTAIFRVLDVADRAAAIRLVRGGPEGSGAGG